VHIQGEERTNKIKLPPLKPRQADVFECDKRFRILVAGRRFGKTFLALQELVRAADRPGKLAWYVAPSYRQAKSIAWKPLKDMTRGFWAARPLESELRIELTTGGTICLLGADNYDSLRGNGLDFLVLDEYASISREAWPEALRPALADKLGRALLIGTPHGHDHFHDLYQSAQDHAHWQTFQFTTEQGGNVPPEEIACATQELDERTYRQEFQASFENVSAGRVYFSFNRSGNVEKVEYNSRLPLFWSLDFNVNPMCSVIGQRHGYWIHVLDELFLADSNTQAACVEFHKRAANWGRRLPVHVYGDSSGNGRHTSASRTDWQIVKEVLGGFGYQVHSRVPAVNPAVKDRTNCVNALLCNHAGERKLLIHPGCKELITDLEQVTWDADSVDKSDPRRTHMSDALGYVVAQEFGMRPSAGYGPGRVV
jgi:Terminase large subunit, T4likevirus-type, N-terminal